MYTIYQDLDGCVADFVKGINNEVHKLIQQELYLSKRSEKKHIRNFIKNFGKTKTIDSDLLKDKRVRPLMYYIASQPGFFSRLPKMNNNLWEVVKSFSIHPKVRRIEFLTAPIGVYAIEDKTAWVRKILNSNAKVNVVERKEKVTFCTSSKCILIDDYAKTVNEWNNSGGYGLHFTNNVKEIEQKLMTILK